MGASAGVLIWHRAAIFWKEVSSCAESFLSELLRRPWDQALLSPARFLHPRKLRARNPCSLPLMAIISPSSVVEAVAVGVSEAAAGAGVVTAAVIAASIFRIAQVPVPATARRHRAARARTTVFVTFGRATESGASRGTGTATPATVRTTTLGSIRSPIVHNASVPTDVSALPMWALTARRAVARNDSSTAIGPQ